MQSYSQYPLKKPCQRIWKPSIYNNAEYYTFSRPHPLSLILHLKKKVQHFIWNFFFASRHVMLHIATFQFFPNSFPDDFLQPFSIFHFQDSLYQILVLLPFRNTAQDFPCPLVFCVLQIRTERKNGTAHSGLICPTIRSYPAALALTSVR